MTEWGWMGEGMKNEFFIFKKKTNAVTVTEFKTEIMTVTAQFGL
jgi:hypothetical protein